MDANFGKRIGLRLFWDRLLFLGLCRSVHARVSKNSCMRVNVLKWVYIYMWVYIMCLSGCIYIYIYIYIYVRNSECVLCLYKHPRVCIDATRCNNQLIICLLKITMHFY